MMIAKKLTERYARYGCKGALKTRVLRSTPCALRAPWNLMYAMQIEHHVNRVAMVVKFWNHSKTLDGPPCLHDKYVSSEMDAVIKTQ